jgi:hypothetical protein
MKGKGSTSIGHVTPKLVTRGRIYKYYSLCGKMDRYDK